MRYGARYIEGARIEPVLVFASIEAKVKGIGTFTKLLLRLKRQHPTATFFVENVLNSRFAKKLKRLGFHQVKGESSFAKSCVSFFLPPEEELRS